MIRSRLCGVVIAGILMIGGGVQAAQFTQVELGYQRQAQVGNWMPARVTAAELSPEQSVSLVLTTRDARSNHVTEVCAAGRADQNGAVTLSGLARTGRLDGSIEVRLIDSESSETLCSASVSCSDAPLESEPRRIQTQLRMYRHDVRFVLTIGQPAGLDELLARARQLSPENPPLVGLSVRTAEELPEVTQAYRLFSTIVFNGYVSLSDQQFDAIRSWVYEGGQLIVGCSDQIVPLLETSLGQWLDEHFEFEREIRSVTDADLAAMQQIVPQATRISTFRRKVNMSLVSSDQPVLLARSGSVPLVARTGSGGGTLTYIAVNLDKRPLSEWNSLPDFYAVLIMGSPLNKVATRSSSSRISSSGISDLTTQLMATADPPPQSGRWTTWSIMGLAFAWLVLIGPVDYFLVVVLLKRPHLTWVTLPLWVIAASAALYSLKSAETETALHSVHLLDVTQDATYNSVSAMSLMSVSTPYTSQVQLTAVPASQLGGTTQDASLSWAGRPDDVYGGMYRATGIGGGSQSYTRKSDQPVTLASVPLLIDGSFETQTTWTAAPEVPLAQADFSVSGFGLLNGTFRHELPVPLRDWVVVFGNRIYRARDEARASLPPGQLWEFQQGGSQISDLKSWLTGPREIREEPVRRAPGQQFASQPYSVGGRDPLDIVTMMSLYDLAGADGYTGLNHDALASLDMSDSIRLNYALVIGWIDLPATRLEIDGELIPETETTTIVRLLLPVDRRPASAAAMTAADVKAAEEAKNKAAETPPAESSGDEVPTDGEPADTEQEPSSD